MAGAGDGLTMEMEVTPRVVNGAGVLHGGLLATLVDMAAGSLLMRDVEPGRRFTTSDMHVATGRPHDPAGQRLLVIARSTTSWVGASPSGEWVGREDTRPSRIRSR